MKNAVIILLLVIIAGLVFGLGFALGRPGAGGVDGTPILQAEAENIEDVKYGEKLEITTQDLVNALQLQIEKYRVKLPEAKILAYVFWIEEWSHETDDPVIRKLTSGSLRKGDNDTFIISCNPQSENSYDAYRMSFGSMALSFQYKPATFSGEANWFSRFPRYLTLESGKTVTVKFSAKHDNGFSYPGYGDLDKIFETMYASAKEDSKYVFTLFRLTVFAAKDDKEADRLSNMRPIFNGKEIVLDGLASPQNTPDVF